MKTFDLKEYEEFKKQVKAKKDLPEATKKIVLHNFLRKKIRE